jgi:hypothetical protein
MLPALIPQEEPRSERETRSSSLRRTARRRTIFRRGLWQLRVFSNDGLDGLHRIGFGSARSARSIDARATVSPGPKGTSLSA